MSHNDLMELTLNHLQHASMEPKFFLSLAETTPAVCMGVEKNLEDCEQNCGQYHRRSNIAEANDRSRQWETPASLLSMHRSGDCTEHKVSKLTWRMPRESNTPQFAMAAGEKLTKQEKGLVGIFASAQEIDRATASAKLQADLSGQIFQQMEQSSISIIPSFDDQAGAVHIESGNGD